MKQPLVVIHISPTAHRLLRVAPSLAVPRLLVGFSLHGI